VKKGKLPQKKRRAFSAKEWIRESNLLDGVDSRKEDARCVPIWDWFVRKPLSVKNIQELHNKMMVGHLPAALRGKWRESSLLVGGTKTVDWESVPYQLDLWIERWRGVVQWDKIKEAHAELERIHPFMEGNGRVARMVMNWQLAHACLQPRCIKEVFA